MVTVLIYLLLCAFWIEKVLDLHLISIRGVSFFNLILYVLLMVWLFSSVRVKKMLKAHPANKYLFLMLCIILLSIPNKILRGEFPHVGILREADRLQKSALPPHVSKSSRC